MPEPDPAAAVATPNQFPCSKCGADLVFKPGTTAQICRYCGARTEIAAPPDAGGVEELDYRVWLRRLEETAPTETCTTLKCNACAAHVKRPEHVTAMSCPFCAAKLVVDETCRTVIQPGSLLPFEVTREQAFLVYRRWVARRWFAPTKLKRFARQDEDLRGIYLPYWTYDCETTTAYTGMRGDHYYVSVGSGKNRRREQRTRWTPAAGEVRNAFDDLLVAASRSIPARRLDSLAPWDLENLVPYADEYLAGFVSESYQVDLPDGFEVARGHVDREVRRTIARDIGGDRQQIHGVDTRYGAITFKHLLAPVWMSAYRYRGRVFRILVNARTGEVQGDRPWSAWKIAGAIAAALAVVLVIVLVASLR